MLRKIKLPTEVVIGQLTEKGKDGTECADEPIDQEERTTRKDSTRENTTKNKKGQESEEGATEEKRQKNQESIKLKGKQADKRYNLRERVSRKVYN